MWESHSDSDRIAGKRVELGADNQSGDSRTWERNRAAVVVDTREPEKVVREEVLDPIWMKFVEACEKRLLLSRTEQRGEGSGNERGFEGVGQSLGPWRIKAPLTLGGGGPFPHRNRMPPWQMPRVDEGSDQWEVDGQEFPKLGTQQTASKFIGSTDPGDTGRGQSRDGHTNRIPRVVDRGMRPAKCSRTGGEGSHDVQTWDVPGTLTVSLSPWADIFTPGRTPDNSQNQQQNTDMDLHRSLAMTGVSETESPWNNINDKNATMVLADSIEIEQPVAVADVAEPGGPAGRWSG